MNELVKSGFLLKNELESIEASGDSIEIDDYVFQQVDWTDDKWQMLAHPSQFGARENYLSIDEEGAIERKYKFDDHNILDSDMFKIKMFQ